MTTAALHAEDPSLRTQARPIFKPLPAEPREIYPAISLAHSSATLLSASSSPGIFAHACFLT